MDHIVILIVILIKSLSSTHLSCTFSFPLFQSTMDKFARASTESEHERSEKELVSKQKRPVKFYCTFDFRHLATLSALNESGHFRAAA